MSTRKIFTVLTVLLLGAWLSAAPASSQTRGSSRGGSQAGGHGRTTDTSVRRQGDLGRHGEQAGRGDTVRQRQRIEINAEQRQCYGTAASQGETAQRQARGMASYANGGAFDPEMAARQGTMLRDQVRDMLHEHDQMMAGFSDAQRDPLAARLHKLDRVRDRLQTHLGAMQRECAGELTADQFRSRARELDRDLQKWMKQHRRLGGQLGEQAG